MINFKFAKQEMIEKQILNKNITNKRVIKAIKEIDRHLFVSNENLEQSYEDHSLPIGHNQTISQPYITALMTELLYPGKDEIILEIGTGSGYQTAIIAKLSKFVISIERIRELADKAKENLKKSNIKNATVLLGDGSLGWKDNAPYDGIIVTAGADELPQALIDQLKVGGRMIIPVGKKGSHKLQLILKEEDKIVVKKIIDCSFVPLIRKGVHKKNITLRR